MARVSGVQSVARSQRLTIEAPAALAREKDEVWDVGFGTLTYPRGIRAANRPYIVEHYRAYGGPKPPPIDHQGIEDGTEKGSTIYYHYRGRWFQLTGAD